MLSSQTAGPDHSSSMLPPTPPTQLAPAPEAFFRYQIDSLNPGRVIFRDYSRFHPATWRWDFGDGSTANLANVDHTFTNGGVFEVCLMVANENGDDFICEELLVPSVVNNRNYATETSLSIAPNPVYAGSRLRISGQANDLQDLQLINAHGQMIQHWPVLAPNANLDLPVLPAGIYWLRFMNGQQIESARLVIK